MSNFKLFLFAVLLCCLCVKNYNNVGVEASHISFPKLQSQSAVIVNHTHMTGFHFRPPRNWINDPNGPMYYNGIYHFFYQYNPYGSVWGNIVWAHSVSTDMINWKSLKHALSASKPFDINGCWSGSATILPGNKPVLLYTGIDSKQRQLQNYALPVNLSDPYLQDWIKPDNNPLIVPGIGINATQFRDPTTAWIGLDGKWRILIGGGRKHRGLVYMYRSRDFMKWTKAKHPLHSAANSWNWECPDFFPVALYGKHGLDTSVNGEGVKHVLKVSLDKTRFEYYTVGTYDREKDRYIPDNTSVDGWSGPRYDYGNFYASKSFFDAGKNRRILWGWANESDTKENDTEKGWAGIQTIPRSVWLDPSKRQLVQWPIEELETLRMNGVVMKNRRLKMGEHAEIKNITAAQVDVDMTFLLPNLDKAEPFDYSWVDPQQLCAQKGSTDQGVIGPFGILALASKNLEEYTPIFFRIFNAPNKHIVLMCSDARSSSLRPKDLYKPTFAGFVDVDLTEGRLSLRSLIDHSMVESFGAGGKTCITSRVYPELAINRNAHLFVFNNGSETVTVENLHAWSMRDVDMDKDLKL